MVLTADGMVRKISLLKAENGMMSDLTHGFPKVFSFRRADDDASVIYRCHLPPCSGTVSAAREPFYVSHTRHESHACRNVQSASNPNLPLDSLPGISYETKVLRDLL